MMTNDEIAKRITRGTTTNWTKVQILFNDGNWALVKWPGGRTGGRFMDSHVSPWVEQINLSKLTSQGRSDTKTYKTVWECDRDKDGRLTKSRVKTLVENLKLDPQFIQETTTPKRRLRRPDPSTPTKPKKQRRIRLDTSCVQVCLFIEGDDLPEDWDAIVERDVVIVGTVTETGIQINGYYFLLEYNSLIDLMEFYKNDREKILDALELRIDM